MSESQDPTCTAINTFVLRDRDRHSGLHKGGVDLLINPTAPLCRHSWRAELATSILRCLLNAFDDQRKGDVLHCHARLLNRFPEGIHPVGFLDESN